jgi:hypothetical protein
VNVTTQKKPKTHVTDNATPKIQQSQTHTDESKQQTERCQAAESMDSATVGNHAEPITPHGSEKKKTKHTNPNSYPQANMVYQKMQKTKNSVARNPFLPTTVVIWKKHSEVYKCNPRRQNNNSRS